MFAGSMVLGITVLSFAAWLHWNDIQGWPNEPYKTEVDNQYLARRKRSRKRIHIIIAACGVFILVAAIAGPGPIWVAAWMSVILALLTVIILALFDAFRTHRYQKTKVPEIRRDILGDDP
jgi:Flp pilus assembly protein TadB